MIRRGLALLLCGYLLVWIPFTFANELFAAVPTLRMRGLRAVFEIALHGTVALLCATAGWMVLTRSPSAPAVAAPAVVAAGAASVLGLFWSALPRNVPPGAALPLAALAIGLTLLWLAVVRVIRS